MRRAAIASLAALWMALRGPATGEAAEPAPPAPRQGVLSTQVIPLPSREAKGADWDSLRSLEGTRRWAASESVATALVRSIEAERRPDSLALSRALLYIAHSRLMRRLHAEDRGVETLERALGIRKRHAIRNDTLVIWAHVRAATFFGEAGHPKRAVEHGERGLHLLESMTPTDTSMLAESHRTLAAALVAVGRDSEAGAHFESALTFRQRADGGEGVQLYPIMADYAGYLSRVGELERARAMLERAVGIAASNPRRGTDYATCLGRLSSFERRVGNIAESVELAWQAFEFHRRMDATSVHTLRARTTLAYRLQDFGDMHGAAAHLWEILPPFAAALGANHPQTVNARLSLVQTLVALGDTAAAARELAAAQPALAHQDLSTNNNQIFAMQLGADLDVLRGQNAAARDTLAAAAEIEWSTRDPFGARQAALLAHLYTAFRNAADQPHALAAARLVDRLTDSTQVRATPEWHALVESRAAAESRVGLRDLAWQHALEAERLSRERLAYQIEALPDLRGLQLSQELGRPCELLVALANPGDEAELATAWDRIVRWRGMVRHEIGRRRAPVAASTDTAVAGAHDRWVAAQRRLAQLVVSGAAHPDDPESAARYERSKQQAEDAERAFARISRGQASSDSVATLDRVLARLSSHQALVAFAVASDGAGESTLGAFVANGRDRRPRWVALGPADAIERDVRAWVGRLSAPPPGAGRAEEQACRRLGSVVRERVWDPISRAAGDAAEVILVPEGVMTELPWLALPGAHGKYLVESPLGIRRIGAERDLLADPSAMPAGSGLLAAGGPDFEGAGAGMLAAASTGTARLQPHASPCAQTAALSLPPLPAARAEAERIFRSWPASAGAAQLLVGADATEAALKSAAPGKAVIHLATHGVMIDDSCRTVSIPGTRGVGGVSPLTSGKTASQPRLATSTSQTKPPVANPWLGRQVWLALAGASRSSEGTDENEGLLTAEEVVTLDLRGTDWVVLSACHSGVAGAWAREGVLGMRRAFQLAGARVVIASQWAVGDESAGEWMSALYAARAHGATAGAAVGSAARTVLAARRAQHRATHPFYWAAFSAWGE
ncbi:MAG: CHAT domain-containing tetratricopeptide repeat protein [Candidatus Eisenbacteria bacterium]